MAFEFDLNALYKQAFSTFRGIALREEQQSFDANENQETFIKGHKPFDNVSINLLEDEFGTLRNILGSNMPDGRPVFMPVKIGDLLLPNEPTIEISRKKKIVSTELVGEKRKGSVKELIGFKDIEITIRGVALNHDNTKVYPEQQLKELYDLASKTEALEIQCALTSLLGIYRLVIIDDKYPPMVGVQHAQAYQFKCVSDEDFILEL